MTKKAEYSSAHAELIKELWQAAVNLRGSIEPSDYKRYVLPIVFLRFLSMRFEQRRAQLVDSLADRNSDYFTEDSQVREQVLGDPDEYSSASAFTRLVPIGH